MMKRLASLRRVVIHDRNMVEDDGVELVRDLQVITGRQRLRAEIVEGKARYSHRRLRNPHYMAFDQQFLRHTGMAAG